MRLTFRLNPLVVGAVALVASLSASQALAHQKHKAPRPPAAAVAVTVQEAKAFNRQQERLNQRNDRRMLRGYRIDSQLMLWLTAGDQPVRALLTGATLFEFLGQAVSIVEEVPTATSCSFTARSDGQVLESCASINAARPTPTFSLSLIARDKRGLAYKTVFVTDSEAAAQLLQLTGTLAPTPPAAPPDAEDGLDDFAGRLGQGFDQGMVRPPQ